MNSKMTTKPRYAFFLLDEGDKWTAIGTRKISSLEIEARSSFEIIPLNRICDTAIPNSFEYELRGALQEFIWATGTSPLGALGTLIDALREEEETERLEEQERLKKIKKLTKKNKKKKTVTKQATYYCGDPDCCY